MTEKVQIGDATLYHGDCLEILPTLDKVDAVITDPPYGIGFKYESHDDSPEAYEELMCAIVALCEDRCNGVKAFWQGMKNAPIWHRWFPEDFRIFAACKGFVQYRPTPIQWSWDPVVWWGDLDKEPNVHAKDWHLQKLAPFGQGRERIDHPCPRPLEQVVEFVDRFTKPCQCVLDPFMGSGTTGVACANLGRKFIGIDIERKYFDIACERIDAAYAQGRLFA